MNFQDKVVVVTGGASGIGKAVAEAFGAAGARVAVADLNVKGAESVAAAVSAAGGQGKAVALDVTSDDSVKAAVQQVIDTWGQIDVLANVAGWDKIMNFKDTTPDFWDKVIAINYRGILSTCHTVLPHMIERNQGVIINTASEAGRNGSSGEAVYSGAKGGVIAFTKALAREVARYNVRVNVVAPGLVETPLLQSIMDAGYDKLMDAIKKATPLRRFGRPEEIADAVLFLASDKASFITGQTLGVSGGLVM